MHTKRTLIDSFRIALTGFRYAFRTQRNVRIHCAGAVLVLGMAWLLRVEGVRLALLFGAIGSVLGAELFNTAVEAVVDLYTDEYHRLAKAAKDVAAAAVLVQTVVAVTIGYVVFAQYIPRVVAALPLGIWSLLTLVRPQVDKEVPYDDS